MFNTFNMGVGMTVTVPRAEAERALALLRAEGEDAWQIGEIAEGGEKLEIA